MAFSHKGEPISPYDSGHVTTLLQWNLVLAYIRLKLQQEGWTVQSKDFMTGCPAALHIHTFIIMPV